MQHSQQPRSDQAQAIPIPQALNLAEQHLSSGQIQQADTLLRQILQRDPNCAPALHMLGIVAQQTGQAGLAIQLIEQAIELQPRMALYHSNLGEIYRQQGNPDKAIEHCKEAIRLDPDLAMAHSNLGIAYYDLGRLDEAEACQKKALEIFPNLVAALNNLGSIYRDKKQAEQAEAFYRKALDIAPTYLESMNNLGAVLTEMERPEEAVELLQRALQMNPNYADALHNLGLAWLLLEDEAKAEQCFGREMQLQPQKAEPYIGLAQIRLSQQKLPEAEALTRKALELNAADKKAHSLLGEILNQGGFPDQAEEAFRKALELDPQHEGALLGLGKLLMERGELDKAREHFEAILAFDPDCMGARLSLVQCGKVKEDDPHMRYLAEQARQIDDMLETKAMSLHFALGKCYDDLNQPDLAFPHFAEGCRLRRKRLEYSAEAHSRQVDAIIEFFSTETLADLRGTGCPSEVPIFVLGMPRSGTTLTEQIIASHPLVHGAGELPDLLNIANRPRGEDGPKYPESLAGITQAELRALGEKYVAGLRQRAPDAAHITDKMPANYLALGLIHLMLPKAKIIHVQRNPVDTCLSNFTKLFGHKAQPHSYDLRELGMYYRDYARLMDHWHAVLPKNAFYDIRYEELVADFENQARNLIAFCELDWDDACIRFHETKRVVKTASVTQVRQPIYNSSVARWKRYEPHLQPLLDILGDLVPDAG